MLTSAKSKAVAPQGLATTPEEVRVNVLGRAKNGSVVLMHSWSENSLGALPQILAAAKEQNYRAVALR